MDLKNPIPLDELLGHCELSDSISSGIPAEIIIHSIDSPENSNENSLTFIGKKTPRSVLNNLKCAYAFREWEAVEVDNPGNSVKNILPLINNILESCQELFSDWDYQGIHEFHSESEKVKGKVDVSVELGPGTYVGPGSVIHAGCVLEPGAIVMDNCLIENNVRIQAGAVIGSAGFGFYSEEGEKIPVRHAAGVHIAKDCWIGANTVIAAGVLNPTFIGHSSKIDSHVQIAHNVSLDHHAVIASQSGIAGSTRIGHHLLMGGASSIAGHLNIGANVTVAARTGVTKNIKEGQIIAGFPAQPINKWKKQQVHLRKL